MKQEINNYLFIISVTNNILHTRDGIEYDTTDNIISKLFNILNTIIHYNSTKMAIKLPNKKKVLKKEVKLLSKKTNISAFAKKWIVTLEDL